jgi:hypothetical protein
VFRCVENWPSGGSLPAARSDVAPIGASLTLAFGGRACGAKVGQTVLPKVTKTAMPGHSAFVLRGSILAQGG